MENKKRGLGGLGCTEDRGTEHKARRRGRRHSFECLLFISPIHTFSPSNFGARVGRVRTMWMKGGCLGRKDNSSR